MSTTEQLQQELAAAREGWERCAMELADAVRKRDEARAEVERLKAQHLERHLESWEQHMQDNDVKRAYRRGAEAMREACAREASVCANHRGEELADILGALPIPEET